MPIAPYALGSYKRADLPRLRLVNQYPEKSPASPAGVILLPRPALQAYAEIGAGPIRLVFNEPGALSDALFTISATALYNGSSNIGSIPGEGLLSATATLNRLIIGNEEGLFTSDGASVTERTFPDGAGVSSVAYLNGYALATRLGSRRIYFTLDPDTWDGLDFISAEQSTGDIVTSSIVGDQLWIFAERVVEIFVTTGDPDIPLQRIEGRIYDKGALNASSVRKLDNTVFWVGHDRIVYRGDTQPLRISDHVIEEALEQSSVAEISAWAFTWYGHSFYVLRTAQGTFAYDAATQEWPEFSSYLRDNWRAWTGTLYQGQVIGGDDESGTLWRLSDGVHLDGDQPIQRVDTTLIEGPGFIDNFVLDASTGEAISPTEVAPVVELRTSRDGGHTFSDWRSTPLGRQGRYRQRLAFRRLGYVDGDGLIVECRMSDPTPWRRSANRINEPLVGRGR